MYGDWRDIAQEVKTALVRAAVERHELAGTVRDWVRARDVNAAVRILKEVGDGARAAVLTALVNSPGDAQAPLWEWLGGGFVVDAPPARVIDRPEDGAENVVMVDGDPCVLERDSRRHIRLFYVTPRREILPHDRLRAAVGSAEPCG